MPVLLTHVARAPGEEKDVLATTASDQHGDAGRAGNPAVEHGPGQPGQAAAGLAGRRRLDLADRRQGLGPPEPERGGRAAPWRSGSTSPLALFRAEREWWLLDLADLVVCLQVVLFFQKKDPSIYWQLAIISLSQVVVAALFSHGGMFGIVLVLYMMTGLSALALLFLYTAGEPLWARRGAAAPAADRRPPLAALRRGGRLRRQLGRRRPGRHRRRIVPAFGHAGRGHPGPGDGHFLHRAAAGLPGLARRLRRPTAIVGFTDTVALGQLGEVLESREEVMRVQLTDVPSGHLYPVQPRTLPPRRRPHDSTTAANGATASPARAVRWISRRRAWTTSTIRPTTGSKTASPRPPRRPGRRHAGCGSRSPSSRWIATSCSAFGRRSCRRPANQKVLYDPAQGRLDRKELAARTVGSRINWAPRPWRTASLMSLVPCNDPGVGQSR